MGDNFTLRIIIWLVFGLERAKLDCTPPFHYYSVASIGSVTASVNNLLHYQEDKYVEEDKGR